MRKTRLLVSALAVASLALAACGSDDEDTTTTDAPAAEPTDSAAEPSGAATTAAPATGESTAGTTGGGGEGTLSLEELYAGSFESPPTGAPEPAKDKHIFVLSCGFAAAACLTAADSVKESAELLGWQVTMFDGKLNAGGAYATGYAQAIGAGVDAIVNLGPDCATVRSSLEQAKAANIPVFNWAGLDCDDEFNPEPSEPLYTVDLWWSSAHATSGERLEHDGKADGDYIIGRTGGKAKIIELYYRYQILGEHEHRGFMESMSNCAECEIVESVEFNNDDLGGGGLKTKIAAALAAHPEANALVYTYSSVVPLGNLNGAVRAAGKADSMIVVGGEGSAANLDLIRQGDAGITAEYAYPTEWSGWGLTDSMIRHFAGEERMPQGIGFQMIDKDHNLPPEPGSEMVPPVDFKAVYKKSWGVG
ncbi:MAG: sugar ABC transporter substrate-binding protein [Ilumatobacteraceae bacterium]